MAPPGLGEAVRVLAWGPDTYDQRTWLGSRETRCAHPMRLVGVRRGGTWYRYLANVLEPARLPAADVAALCACRWDCEDAFHLVKRLLGLASFSVGTPTAVQTQPWATWLLYTVLVDLAANASWLGLLKRPRRRPHAHLSHSTSSPDP